MFLLGRSFNTTLGDDKIMHSDGDAPSPSSANTASTCQSTNIPEGFSVSSNVVTEEAWEEIRLYLGLTTYPPRFADENRHSDTMPCIEIDGVGASASESTQIPWESTPFPQNRPVAQFGFRYDYEKDVVVPPSDDGVEHENVPKIPEIFQHLLLRPFQEGTETPLSSVEFTQCIVNVYHPSTPMEETDESKYSESIVPSTSTACASSIPWHFDDPQFGPEILVFTFGETRPLHMRIYKDSDATTSNGTDDRCNDDCYNYFTAYPSHRSCYILSGPARHKWQHSVPAGSGWRVSITFRTLCPP